MRKPNGWHPPYDFQAALPYCVDAWPKAWRDLAPASEIIPLNREEMNALGSQIIGFGDWFKPSPATPLLHLARRLDAAIARLGRSCFVRLTTRSPKDSLVALRKGMKVADGTKALALFVEGSQRCAADLRMALDCGCELGLVVRQWVEFPPWAEFRCFMQDRRWTGASQSHCATEEKFAPIADHSSAIIGTLHQAMRQIIAASTVADAAFDLVFQPQLGLSPTARPKTVEISRHSGMDRRNPDCMDACNARPALLLDANPLSDVTDTALFPSLAALDQTFRYCQNFMDDSLILRSDVKVASNDDLSANTMECQSLL
ncbi:MAG: hypothetical protein NTX45_07970 [Proteobacteria bacterium]|nr:hypothetical protein [Pseudomonadota bacterium]